MHPKYPLVQTPGMFTQNQIGINVKIARSQELSVVPESVFLLKLGFLGIKAFLSVYAADNYRII